MAMPSDSIGSKITTPFFGEGVKFIETIIQLYDVDEQIRDLLKTTRHVTVNLENVRRLRRTKTDQLSARDVAWIDAIIYDTEDGLRGLAKLVERARVEKETKSYISFWNRGCWIARYSPKVRDQQAKLAMCHHSLLSVFPFLFKSNGGLSSVAEESREVNPTPDKPRMEKWLDWQDQRNRRRSNINLRASGNIRRPTSVSSGSTSTTSLSLTSSNSSPPAMPGSPERPTDHGFSDQAPYTPSYHSRQGPGYEARQNYLHTYSENHSSSDSSIPIWGSGFNPQAELSGFASPVFDNRPEDDYNPPSALPEIYTDPFECREPYNDYEGADGLQVCEPQRDTGIPLWWADWIEQLQILDKPTNDVTDFSRHRFELQEDPRNDRFGSAKIRESPRLGPDLADPESPTTKRRITSLPPASRSTGPGLNPKLPFRLSQGSCVRAYQSLPHNSISASENDTNPYPPESDPPMYRTQSETVITRCNVSGRPSISPYGADVHAGEGRSLSTGDSSNRRGKWGWLVHQDSRDTLATKQAWGEG